ncbi:MAG TPA: hypothetical protein VGA56_01425 [Opitutaceae bacterium]
MIFVSVMPPVDTGTQIYVSQKQETEIHAAQPASHHIDLSKFQNIEPSGALELYLHAAGLKKPDELVAGSVYVPQPGDVFVNYQPRADQGTGNFNVISGSMLL